VNPERYSFGPFLLEVEAFRLSRDGEILQLQPKMLELLIRLVRSAGELVSRDVLHAELWPDVVVTEQSLRQTVYRLRELLGEEHQHLIETVPRRGFRFVGVPQKLQEQSAPGAYEILGRLGGGGVAEVFAVRHRVLQRQYALKVLHARSPGLLERLEREARAQARVQHEHVLPILDVIEHEGSPALLLQLVEGPTLQELLEQRPQVALQPADLRVLFVGVARGVAAIHEAGLVHRDLKPHNVLLDLVGDRVVPKVADFGLVKGITSTPLTHTEIAMGTPGWMAPEQLADAASVDARADVWALGRLLLETLGAQAPPDWQDLARRCQAREPEARPADAGEILRQLGELPPDEVSAELVALCRGLGPRFPQDPAHPAPSPPVETGRAVGALPAERDTFIGRHDDLLALSEESARLISVTGPGGVGKTRLALRHARVCRARWPGGAYFCDLSEVRDLDGIVRAVARVLEVPLGRDPVPQLGHALASRGGCLLLLDNFEQVVAHAAETVGIWMDLAEQAQFLVTSREVLGLPGEVVFPVSSLAAADARELFVRRASAVKRGFVPSPEDLSAIDSLTVLLDGLPLALELAAARVNVLAPARILERMDDRFRVLSAPGARRGRQATLRATLDWSWDLLSPDERAALCQLSVFEGGFTLDAAEEVLELEESWPVDTVQGLVHKSLVVPAPAERFTLLVSVQAYAREHLSPAQAQAAEQRHGRYYALLGAEEPDARRDEARYPTLVRELANLEAACRRAVARGDGAVAAETATSAWPVFLRRGPMSSGLQLLQAVLTLPLSPAEAAKVQICSGWALHMLGSSEEGQQHLLAALASARAGGNLRSEGVLLSMLAVLHHHLSQMEESDRHFEQALVVLRKAGARRQEGVALTHLGALRHHQGRVSEAYECHQQALQLLREAGDRRQQGTVIFNLGVWAREQGHMNEGRSYAEESLRLDREQGDRMSEGSSLMNLGNVHLEQGRMEDALACYEEALRLYRELGDRRGEGACLVNLGSCLASISRDEESLACNEAALVIAREVGNRRYEGVVLGNLAMRYQRLDRTDEARAAYEVALQIHREVGNRDFEGITLGALASLLREQGDLRSARRCIDEGEALLRSGGYLLMLGSMLCYRAELEHADHQPEAARAALDEATSYAERLGAGPQSHLGQDLQRTRAFLEG
jgi:predicted ATPase/DNA-binding winged helix-turn-helix (wHTH) protein